MKRYSAKIPLDVAYVKKLRKDFLLLMRNSKRIKDYDQASKWKQYVRKWREDFGEYTTKSLPRALSNLRFQKKITKSDQEYWEGKLRRDLWGLVHEFHVPLESYEYAQKYTPWKTKESLFEDFQKEVPKWDGRVRRKARVTWRALKDFIEWFQTRSSEELSVEIPMDERVSMEGFSVLIKGAEDAFELGRSIGRFKAGLKHYKKRAQQVLPLLLRAQLPIVLDFAAGLDKGGEYHRTFIMINPYAAENNPGGLASILAHEMGHHLFQNYLSSQDQKFWYEAITGNYSKLDLKEVLDKYGKEKNSFLFDNEKIKKEDPILFLQIAGLYHGSSEYVFKNILSMEQLREYLKNGGQAVWNVHGKPITGYAHKNPEEAFCDAVGTLVGYGPQALLPEVRWWLRRILPTVRVSKRH